MARANANEIQIEYDPLILERPMKWKYREVPI